MAKGRLPAITMTSVGFAYGTHAVVSSWSESVHEGEVLVLVGPSGCGKSTLLRLIAGLEQPASGSIVVSDGTAEHPRLRYLFQDYDAFPWLTAYENIRLGSGCAPHPPDENVLEVLAAVGLAGAERRYPAEMSGGMRKRLALARCLVRGPKVLLLDEPFSSLDIDTRHEMYDLVQRLWCDGEMAVLIVTHDLDEAILLADRIVVCSPRPMRVAEVFDVPFSRPRTEEVGTSPEYIEIKRRIVAALASLRTADSGARVPTGDANEC